MLMLTLVSMPTSASFPTPYRVGTNKICSLTRRHYFRSVSKRGWIFPFQLKLTVGGTEAYICHRPMSFSSSSPLPSPAAWRVCCQQWTLGTHPVLSEQASQSVWSADWTVGPTRALLDLQKKHKLGFHHGKWTESLWQRGSGKWQDSK